MIEINTITVSPDTIQGTKTSVTFTWEGSIDDTTENPVQMEFKIENNNPVFFDENGKAKTILSKTTSLTTDRKTYTDTFKMAVSPKPASLEQTNITIKGTDNKGNTSSRHCTLNYQ